VLPLRLRQALPAPLHVLVPATDKILPDCPVFDKDAVPGDNPTAPVAAALLEQLEAREEAEDVEAWLHAESTLAAAGLPAEVAATLPQGWRGPLVLQAMLVSGRRAPSHFFTLLDKYQPLLSALAPGEDGQAVLLRTLVQAHSAEHGALHVLIAACLRQGVFNACTVTSWALELQQQQQEQQVSPADAIWPWAHIISAVDIAIAQVLSAAAGVRALLGDQGMEEEDKLGGFKKAADMSGAITQVIGGGGKARAPDADADADAADAEEAAAALPDAASLEAARAALTRAAATSQRVFSSVLGTLATALAARYEALGYKAGGDAEGLHLDAQCIELSSLSRAILRVFHAAQSELQTAGCGEGADSILPGGAAALVPAGGTVWAARDKALKALPEGARTALQRYD
jgi:hypothetical protein